jgi:hypothetical protein
MLVMHVRYGGAANAIPYSKETFEKVSLKMFQHRSMALIMPRFSTAIFNSKRASWKHQDSAEQSIGKTYNYIYSDIICILSQYFLLPVSQQEVLGSLLCLINDLP